MGERGVFNKTSLRFEVRGNYCNYRNYPCFNKTSLRVEAIDF